MIILDTNVISALMHWPVEARIRAWLDVQASHSIWTSAITVMELRSGLLILPAGKRRAALSEALEAVLAQDIEGRVASFDVAAAEQAASLWATRRKRGRSVEIRDTMIAGIVLASRASLATRNITHFADLGVPVVNPWYV